MYFNVSAKTYVQIRTGYVHIYVQNTSLYVCDTDMSVSYTDMSVSHTHSKYWTVFACICTYFGKFFLAPAARVHLLARARLRSGAWSLPVHVRLGAGARSLHVRRAVAAASSSRGQRGRRRIINKFI